MNTQSPARTEASARPDAALAEELASLPGPLKAQLVVEFLGLNRDGLSDKTFQLPEQKGTSRTNPSQRLIHGVLAELAREIEARKTPIKKTDNPNKPATDHPIPGSRAATSTAPKLRKSSPPENPESSKPKTTSAKPVSLTGEHPIVAAYLLSRMPTETAVACLKALAPNHAQKITLCLSEIESGRRLVPRSAQTIIGAVANQT